MGPIHDQEVQQSGVEAFSNMQAFLPGFASEQRHWLADYSRDFFQANNSQVSPAPELAAIESTDSLLPEQPIYLSQHPAVVQAHQTACPRVDDLDPYDC